MSKPIFIVRLPKNTSEDDLRHVINGFELHPVGLDYHVLCFRSSDETQNDVLFECYNSPHTEIEFQELKNMVIFLGYMLN